MIKLKCARCNDMKCYEGKDCTEISKKIIDYYIENELKTAKVAAKIESEYYMEKNRLEELILYAKEMKYNHLGLAFCIGLKDEAKVLDQILSKYFKVTSVCCKICGIDKSQLGLKRLDCEKEVEAMCNPIAQAEVFNDEKTDLNIIVGLCIGHDILFTNHSKAPVTTFAVKDRVLANNPLGTIYSRYHRKRLLE